MISAIGIPITSNRSTTFFCRASSGAHHSVQSLGRGIADDTELLDWLFDYILPMEASLSADEMEVAAKLGYLEMIESGTTTCVDHLSVDHADKAFEAAGKIGIRGVLGKVITDGSSLTEGSLGRHVGGTGRVETPHREVPRLVRRPHSVCRHPRFAVSCTEECLRGARELADEYEGVRIHTHASENQSEIETVKQDTGMRNIHWCR